MTIQKVQNGSSLTVQIIGRLDTSTAPQLQSEMQTLDGITQLIFDLSQMEYVSSAGLRVFLSTQKTMNKQGTMVVRNANASVREVFEITGFNDILTLE